LKRSNICLQRAIDHMRRNARRRISTQELCTVTGINERTLRYAFRLHLGVSPVRMARLFRLGQTRQELLSATPAATTVTEIAKRFGFGTLSKFSMSYANISLLWRAACRSGFCYCASFSSGISICTERP
jgi:transcriptional regulator GlxA family with amidase domain